jgi:rubrerythrin
MNIFEYAMQMELDGKAFYEENAARIGNPELKKILEELAADEQKHYNIFKAMRDGKSVQYAESDNTTILASVKNVFETLKAENQDFSFPPDARNIWIEAREIEKKSETFYREKAGEVDSDEKKHLLNKIADEEHKHWVTLENVIQFLDRPKTWLEDAEWHHLEDY